MTDLLRNQNQKRILFAENGIDRWHAATVANAIIRRLNRHETIWINHFDAMTINRMAEVLHTGARFPNPFRSIALDAHTMEIPTAEILQVLQ